MATEEGPAFPGEPGRKGSGKPTKNPVLPGEPPVELAFNKTDSDTARRTNETNKKGY